MRASAKAVHSIMLKRMCGKICVHTLSENEKQVSVQPRSQGLSSSHPLERERGGKKRDPGNEVGFSHKTEFEELKGLVGLCSSTDCVGRPQLTYAGI